MCWVSGIEMAMCCDIRVASDDAKFGVPEMGLGIIPAAGGSQTIPRLVKAGLRAGNAALRSVDHRRRS